MFAELKKKECGRCMALCSEVRHQGSDCSLTFPKGLCQGCWLPFYRFKAHSHVLSDEVGPNCTRFSIKAFMLRYTAYGLDTAEAERKIKEEQSKKWMVMSESGLHGILSAFAEAVIEMGLINE
jgi:hypothetical protein